MPSPPITQDILLVAAFDLGAATEGIHRPIVPTRIHRVTYVATISHATATAELELVIEQADGTVVLPSGLALVTMTLTVAAAAVNLVTYLDVQEQYGDMIIYPGEQLSIISDAGGDTGIGDLWLTVEALGFNAPDVRNHAIAGAHPGSTDLPTAFTNVTEVTS